MIQRSKTIKGFTLPSVLSVIILLSSVIILLSDIAANTLQTTYSFGKGMDRYAETVAKGIIDLPPTAGIRMNNSSVWVTSLSQQTRSPDWDSLLSNAKECPASNLWTEVAPPYPISVGTCNTLILTNETSYKLVGNLLLSSLHIQFPLPTPPLEPIQIITSGAIRIDSLTISHPILIISGSGIEIGVLQGNAPLYVLANDTVKIEQNLMAHLSYIYPNFHLKLDEIQSLPVGQFIMTRSPTIYGFWFDRNA